MADVFGMTIMALMSIAIISIAFKMNVFYRIAEALYFGAVAGQVVTTAVNSMMSLDINPLLQRGELLGLAALILGISLFSRLSKAYSWVARYPVSLIVGSTVGLVLGKIIDTQILTMIRPIIAPFSINSLIALVLTVIVGLYFTFYNVKNESIKGLLAPIRSIARPFIVGFFIAYGYANLSGGRVTATTERFIFFIWDWIPALLGR